MAECEAISLHQGDESRDHPKNTGLCRLGSAMGSVAIVLGSEPVVLISRGISVSKPAPHLFPLSTHKLISPGNF